MPAPARSTSPSPLRVLLVDDDEDVCITYRECCASAGMAATTVTSAEAAIECLRQGPAPDVMVLDYSLPGKSGLDLLNLLREDPRTREIPVLIVSGRDLDLRSVHGAPWLRKPVPPDQLLAHIRHAAKVD